MTKARRDRAFGRSIPTLTNPPRFPLPAESISSSRPSNFRISVTRIRRPVQTSVKRFDDKCKNYRASARYTEKALALPSKRSLFGRHRLSAQPFPGAAKPLKRALPPEYLHRLEERRCGRLACHGHAHEGEEVASFHAEVLGERADGGLERLVAPGLLEAVYRPHDGFERFRSAGGIPGVLLAEQRIDLVVQVVLEEEVY